MTAPEDRRSNRLDVVEFGDSYLRARAVDGSDEDRWQRVHAVADRINAREFAGLASAIATYDTVVVQFDPFNLDHENATALLHGVASDLRPVDHESREFAVPVLYGGEVGPDLDDVARAQGLPRDQLVARLTSVSRVIRCFSHHGAAMLDGPDLPRNVPRRHDPRVSVPAGSVTIAGRQSLLHACASPSGWQLVGRTPLQVARLEGNSLTPYRAGDVLTYRSIDEHEFRNLQGTRLEDFLVNVP